MFVRISGLFGEILVHRDDLNFGAMLSLGTSLQKCRGLRILSDVEFNARSPGNLCIPLLKSCYAICRAVQRNGEGEIIFFKGFCRQTCCHKGVVLRDRHIASSNQDKRYRALVAVFVDGCQNIAALRSQRVAKVEGDNIPILFQRNAGNVIVSAVGRHRRNLAVLCLIADSISHSILNTSNHRCRMVIARSDKRKIAVDPRCRDAILTQDSIFQNSLKRSGRHIGIVDTRIDDRITGDHSQTRDL